MQFDVVKLFRMLIKKSWICDLDFVFFSIHSRTCPGSIDKNKNKAEEL